MECKCVYGGAFMYAYVCIYVCTSMFGCIHACTYARSCIHTGLVVCMHASTLSDTHMCHYIHACVYAHQLGYRWLFFSS